MHTHTKHMITCDCGNVYTNCMHDVFNIRHEKINECIYSCATTTFIYAQCITCIGGAKMTQHKNNGVVSTHQTHENGVGKQMDGGMNIHNAIMVANKLIKHGWDIIKIDKIEYPPNDVIGLVHVIPPKCAMGDEYLFTNMIMQCIKTHDEQHVQITCVQCNLLCIAFV